MKKKNEKRCAVHYPVLQEHIRDAFAFGLADDPLIRCPELHCVGHGLRRDEDSALEENIYVPQTDVDRASVVISKMGL